MVKPILGMISLTILFIALLVIYWKSMNTKRKRLSGMISTEEARRKQIECLVAMFACLIIATILRFILF